MELPQESNNEQLYQAALHGNTQRVAELLKQNKDIDISYKHAKTGITSLAAAVKGGYSRIVSLLLMKGANPNDMMNEDGKLKSLLYVAAAANHPAIVKLLLRSGGIAVPNATEWTSFGINFTGIDRKLAHLLCTADPANQILNQIKVGSNYCNPWYVDTTAILKDVITQREKYNNMLLQLYTRIKDLQTELSDLGNIINMATDRVKLEAQLNSALNAPPTLKDYNKIAGLGVQLVNLEKSAASYCLIEEDCAALPAKYHAVIADIASIYKPLEDTHQFVFLKDFIDLCTALKAVDLTPLHAALQKGLLRPAIQLDQLPQQQLQQKQGVSIKQERF